MTTAMVAIDPEPVTTVLDGTRTYSGVSVLAYRTKIDATLDEAGRTKALNALTCSILLRIGPDGLAKVCLEADDLDVAACWLRQKKKALIVVASTGPGQFLVRNVGHRLDDDSQAALCKLLRVKEIL